MRVVVAPDSFKGSVSAQQCARALTRGILSRAPLVEIVSTPLADGGEGTLDALALRGFEIREGFAPDAHGVTRQVRSAWQADTVVIESAQACPFIPDSSSEDALLASSSGVGVMINTAIRQGASHVLLAVGGTASSDGGKGMLEELGVRFLDTEGKRLQPGGGSLKNLAHIKLEGLAPKLSGTSIRLLSDVENPLLGANGAAQVFGPQKGADDSGVRDLEEGLSKLASLLGPDMASAAGAGAGGGLGFAALSALQASQVSGAETMIDLMELKAQVQSADLVITGEGSFDSQSLGGKLTGAVLALAARSGVPAVVVCGIDTLSAGKELEGLTVHSVLPLSFWEPNPKKSMEDAERLLEDVGKRLGNLLSDASSDLRAGFEARSKLRE